MALELVAVFAPGAKEGTKMVSLVTGAIIGGAFYFLAAAKARPLACMFITLAPFLVIATILFSLGPSGATVAAAAVLAGLVLGTISMWHLRPMAIMSTSLFGAVCLMAVWGALSRLLKVGFMQSSLKFLIAHPWAFISAILFVAVMGANLQSTLGMGKMVPHRPESGPNPGR